MTSVIESPVRSKINAQVSQLLLKVNNDMALTESLDSAMETLVTIITRTIGAERGTIFLNDEKTGELYSRVAQGSFMREMRELALSGLVSSCHDISLGGMAASLSEMAETHGAEIDLTRLGNDPYNSLFSESHCRWIVTVPDESMDDFIGSFNLYKSAIGTTGSMAP